MTEEEFKRLIDKLLDGRATPEEEKIVSEFEKFSLSKHNERVFKSDFEKFEVKNKIFSKVRRKIRGNKKSWFSIAASIAVLIGLGTSLFYYQNHRNVSELIVTNTSDTFEVIKLKDGSSVTLSKNSTIRFDNDLDGTRYLELDGEAFFEISRNEKKPFLVKTGGVLTKVLGTSFNISENDSEINITVATGLVEVSENNNSIRLTPNQRTTYQKETKSFHTSHIDHNLFTSWYKNSVKLEEVSIEELAKFITYKYGLHVRFIDEAAKNNRMTLNLNPKADIGSLIDDINFINEVKVTKTKNNMITIELK